jgi:CRP-like cAMP-binding protein
MGKCFSVSSLKSRHNSTYSSPDYDLTDELKNVKQVPNFPINPIAKSLIISALSKNYLFNDLSLFELERLLKRIKFCVAEENNYIFHQGSTGSYFYIINSGRVEILVDGKSRGILNQEDCFGELALLSDSIRRASVKALCKSSFWVISRRAFLAALKDLFKKNYDNFRKIISESVFFRNFSDAQIDAISRLSVKGSYQDKEVIIREGVVEKMLFLLKRGCVVFRKGSEEFLRISNSGEMFGEDMILTGEKSRLWCFAHGQTEVISINLFNLQAIFGENYEEIMLRNVAKISIIADPHLNFLDKDKVINLCLNLKWRRFQDRELVISKKYQKFTYFRVVCTGVIKTKGNNSNSINSYQVIGLGNMNEKNLKEMDYFSDGPSIIGEISIEEINESLGIDTNKLFESLDRIKFIKSIALFSGLSLDSIKKLSEGIKSYTVQKGGVLFEADDPSKEIFLVKSGIIEIVSSSGKSLRFFEKYEIFGEKCLFEKKRTATAKCKEEAELYLVSRSLLKSLPELPSIILEAKRKEYYQRSVNLANMIVTTEVSLNFKRKTFYIRDPIEGHMYNLIIIPKCELESELDCLRLAKERMIMIQIEHRQLIKLVCSSFDYQNVYFITEFIEGRSLQCLLPIPENIAKFFTLHLIHILQYLHDKSIAYRDFNTENILISLKNIPYLYNFSCSKVVENRTYSRVGSPYYRSPEMIMGRGYTKSTDIWSLGVVLFELIYNRLPFKMSKKDTPVDAYEKILKVKHGFEPSKGEVINDLLLGMLSPSSSRFDLATIQRNLWFSNLDKESVIHPKHEDLEMLDRKATIEIKTFTKSFKAINLMNVTLT